MKLYARALLVVSLVSALIQALPVSAAIEDMIARGVNVRDDAVDDLKDLAEMARTDGGIVIVQASPSALGPFIRPRDVRAAVIFKPDCSVHVIPNSGVTTGLLLLPSGVTARGTLLMQPQFQSKLGTLIMERGLGMADGRLDVAPGSVFIEDQEAFTRAEQVAVRSPGGRVPDEAVLLAEKKKRPRHATY